MSFKFATPWNFWLFLSLGLVAVFALVSFKAPWRYYRITRNLLVSLCLLAVLSYALISSGGLFVFFGRVSALERLTLIVPLASPLALLVFVLSKRWAAVSMWLLFLWMQGYYCWLNWPSIYGMLMTLGFDWPLLMGALTLSVIAWHDRRRSDARKTTVPAWQ